jgi:hypothetical protein
MAFLLPTSFSTSAPQRRRTPNAAIVLATFALATLLLVLALGEIARRIDVISIPWNGVSRNV